ncbi:MAG: L-threonylcarbamoyladenylate synthase [Spirochaetaceae bacterium]|jgi:tRNA threonylcarbamoyl adenosine modification protein (Sua5/YciO/YrdC/YwlC family)|nr:L-threonylcarbamoyladenylate synthase [Spirochaetaceae bacterium]
MPVLEHLVRDNIDKRVINRAADFVRRDGIIAMPTDTTWTAACAFSSKAAVQKLRRISGERDERHFTLLCSKIAQFGGYCDIDTKRYRLINKYMPGQYVFILKTLHGTGKTLGLKRSELGVRVPDHPVPVALINELDMPLYSITAKRSMLPVSNADNAGIEDDFNENEVLHEFEMPPIPEQLLFECGYELLEIKNLGMILDTGEELARQFSTIVNLTGAEPYVIRKGAGDFPA